MTPTSGEAASDPTREAAIAAVRAVATPDLSYVVRELETQSPILVTDDIGDAIDAANAAPGGAYIDHVDLRSADPLGLNLTGEQKMHLAAGGRLLADRTLIDTFGKPGQDQAGLDADLYRMGCEYTGLPPMIVQESMARIAATFGRES